VYKVRFVDADGLILVAVPCSDSGSTLRDIISMVDMINHAVPSRTQIEGAIRRGIQAGLVEEKDGVFNISPSRREEVSAVFESSPVFLRKVDAMSQYLAGNEWRQRTSQEYKLSQNQYRDAVKSYLNSF
jgi:hypothetical protein